MNIGRWQPSKFFVFELCTIHEIYSWFNLLISIFFWINYSFLFTFSKLSYLYIKSDLKEYNELIGKHIDWTRDPNMDPELFLFAKPLITYFFKSLTIGENLIEFYAFKVEQQRLQNEAKTVEKPQLLKWKRKKILPELQKVFFDLNTSYEILFPHDIKFNQWLHWDFFHFKKKFLYCPWSEIINLSYLEFDLLERLNLMHVIWSYINWWVWSGVKNFLFFYVYYYFPLYSVFPTYFKDNILRNYFWTINFLLKPTAKDDKYVPVRLPPVAELHLFNFFLEPLFLDKKLPWIDFTTTIIYTIKPLSFNLFVPKLLFTKFFFSSIYRQFLQRKWKNFLIDTLEYNILLWLLNAKYFHLWTVFSLFEFEFLAPKLFFSSKGSDAIIRLLEKIIWKRRCLKFFKLAFFKKISKNYVSNDNFFFWPFYDEFNVIEGPYKFKWKWGRPPKKYSAYFESELEDLEPTYSFNLYKLDQFDFFLTLLREFSFQFSRSNSFASMILLCLLDHFKKPF